MTFYQCDNCKDVFEIKEGEPQPEECPKCDMKCAYRDVTNYTDEYGGPGNIDTRLLKK